MTQSQIAQQAANHPLAAPYIWLPCHHTVALGTTATMDDGSSRKSVVVVGSRVGPRHVRLRKTESADTP